MAFSKQLCFRPIFLWKELCGRSLAVNTPSQHLQCKSVGFGSVETYNSRRSYSKCLPSSIYANQIRLISTGNRVSSLFTNKSVVLIDVLKMSASTSASPSPKGSTAPMPPPPPGKQEGDSNPNAKSDSSTAPPVPQGALSTKDKLKQAVRDYGATVLVFHVTMSLMSLGFFYVLVSSGLDVVGLLAKIGISESITQSKITEEAGKFVVAYAVHKVFAPLRITITLTATPFIVKKLRSMGILKQMAKPKTQ